jgi:hypothetical protein
VSNLDALIGELDIEITRAGVRGKVTTSGTGSSGCQPSSRRSRSTRRRQDAANLPRRKVDARTTSRVYTAPDGKRYRPSMFLTLTCDSYDTERYTHVATLQTKDASKRMDRALWAEDERNFNPNCNLRRWSGFGALSIEEGRGPGCWRRLGDLNPGWAGPKPH